MLHRVSRGLHSVGRTVGIRADLPLQFKLLTAGGKRASSLPAPAFPFGLAPRGRSFSPATTGRLRG